MKTKTLTPARIKSLREYQGWSQTKLAEKSGVGQSYISRLEDGEAPNVAGIVLAKLATALGTSVDYLLGLTDNPFPTPSANSPTMRDPLFQDLLAAWQVLTKLADMGDEAGRNAKTALRLQAQAYKNLAEERLKRKTEQE